MNSVQEHRSSVSEFVQLNGLKHHIRRWLPVALDKPEQNQDSSGQNGSKPLPVLVLLHGWMDVGASFQFMVDALGEAFVNAHTIVAPDWRGYGLSQWGSGNYYFTDYLADLDALLNHVSPDQPVYLLGHSMGGNVACIYAGVRPERVAKLINIEGFGLRAPEPQESPVRLKKWLDQLRTPETLRPYSSLHAVAQRLQKNNPRLTDERAAFLAQHWAQVNDDDQVNLRADPVHKQGNPILYRVAEVMACWRAITAPVLWINGADSNTLAFLGNIPDLTERQTNIADLRILNIANAGHMVQHDQPLLLAQAIEQFLS